VAVYERTYRPYVGPQTPERGRFMVLPRYAIREVLRTRMLFAYLMACMLVPLGCAILIYLPYNATFLKTVLEQLGGGIPTFFDWNAAHFFRRFMIPQFFFAFFLVFLIGPALISADMRNNALPLYFSRPFNRWEYLLGKSFVLVLLVSGITWVPGSMLFLLKAYLAGGGWFMDNLRIGAAMLVSWWIFIAVMTLISLAVSAYVKWKPVARLGLFFIFVVGGGFAGILNLTLRTHWGSLFNIGDMIRVVWGKLFDVPEGVSEVPLGAAFISLAVVCLICVVLLQRKVRAYEVVRS
jgi:ABC-2 type transport system permease protein